MIALAGPTIAFAGGADDEDLNVGIAVAEQLHETTACRALFIGPYLGEARRMIAAAGFSHVALREDPGLFTWRNPWRLTTALGGAFHESVGALESQHVAAVVALGGIESLPIVWAANERNIPVISLRSKPEPGRAAARLSRRAAITCVSSFEPASSCARRAPLTYTGMPVRSQIARLAMDGDLPWAFGLQQPSDLLVLGDPSINRAMLACIAINPDAYEGWRIVHETGRDNVEPIRRRYTELGIEARVVSRLDSRGEAYRTAKLVVGCASSSVLAEIACAGVASILIGPLQRMHRAWLCAGAGCLLEQTEHPLADAKRLAYALSAVWHDEAVRLRMADAAATLARPYAAADVAREILRIVALRRNRHSSRGTALQATAKLPQ